MRETWYDRSIEQLEHRFSTDRGSGLGRADIKKIRREYGANDIYPTPSSGFFGYRSHIFIDFASTLLFVAAILAAIFGLPVASGTIIVLLIINHIASVFTFAKAQKVLEGMAAYSLPTAKVIRDGKLSLIDMRALVPGDVIFLSAGDIVPADCRLFASDNLYINEALITGVASSRRKDAAFNHFAPGLPLSERANMAYAATIVTAGNGRAIVVETGKNTVSASLGKTKPIVTHENLKVLAALKKTCSKISLAMLTLIFTVTLVGLFSEYGKTGLFDIFLTGSALAAASMSELFTAFGYIMIGCGVFNAMKRRHDVNVGALIKNTEKLESLKDVNCVIIPKDGMITVSHSIAEKIYVPGKLFGASDADNVSKFRSVVLCGVISTGIYGAGLSDLNSSSRRITPEEEALVDLADLLGLYNSGIDRDHPIIEHKPAGGASKFDTTLTLDTDKRYMAVCRGEAQEILNSCEYYTRNGSIYRMTTDDRLVFLGTAESLIKSSYKIAAVATGTTGYNNLTRIGSIQSDLTFEGFIALREPLEPGVAQTISKCRAAGVRVIMTTDRYTESDKYLAMSVGLIKDEKEILTENRRLSYSKDMLRVNLPFYNMYCGIPPAGIAEIVTMLRADGAKVALLAGGISGAMLLRTADVGFAESVTISPKAKRGIVDIRSRGTPAYSRIADTGGHTFDSEALKFISDVVVSDADKNGDGGFRAVVSALEFSHSIFRNMLRILKYLVTVQLARIFLVLGSILLGSVFPEISTPDAVQLVFGGLIVDFAAVVTVAFAKPPHDALTMRDDVMYALAHPIRTNIRPAVFALAEAVTLLAVVPAFHALGLNPGGSYSTVTFLAFTLFQLVTLTAYESDRSVFAGNLRVNTIQAALTFGLTVFFALGMAVPEFGALFSFGKLGAAGFAVVAVMTLLTFTLHELYKLAASHSPSDRGRKKKEPAEKPKKAPTVKKGSIFGLDDTDDDDSPESDDAGDTSDDISYENDINENENETESENDD